MAKTAQQPRNLPAANGEQPNVEAPVNAANATDRERLEKARAARQAAIPPEERQLINAAESLRSQIEASDDDAAIAELRKQLATIERQRKGLAFVRKAGDYLFEVQELAKRIKALAGSNYVATDAQRAKVKNTYSMILSDALNEFDRAAPEAADNDAKSRKQEARRAAAAMFKA